MFSVTEALVALHRRATSASVQSYHFFMTLQYEFPQKKENIPFVWFWNNRWHWPRVQDVACSLAWPGLCLWPVQWLDRCHPSLLAPVAISGSSSVTGCRDLVSGGGLRWASRRNGLSLLSQTLSLDGGLCLPIVPLSEWSSCCWTWSFQG